MLEKLRTEIAGRLGVNGIGILCVAGLVPCASPVRYRRDGLQLECLLPHWSDTAYYLESQPCVVLINLTPGKVLSWIQYVGTIQPVSRPDWTLWMENEQSPLFPEALYLVVRIQPTRIDLIDESRGWGVRETLELG